MYVDIGSILVLGISIIIGIIVFIYYITKPCFKIDAFPFAVLGIVISLGLLGYFIPNNITNIQLRNTHKKETLIIYKKDKTNIYKDHINNKKEIYTSNNQLI